MHIMLVAAFMPVNQAYCRIRLLNATGSAEATGQSKGDTIRPCSAVSHQEMAKTRMSGYQSWTSQSAILALYR